METNAPRSQMQVGYVDPENRANVLWYSISIAYEESEAIPRDIIARGLRIESPSKISEGFRTDTYIPPHMIVEIRVHQINLPKT